VGFLLIFPIVTACILFGIKNFKIRRFVVVLASIGITAAALIFAYRNFFEPSHYYIKGAEKCNIVFLIIEFIIMFYICYVAVKRRKHYVAVLSVVQTLFMSWLELSGKIVMKEAIYFIRRI
jgi:ech hydrogenase subunit A